MENKKQLLKSAFAAKIENWNPRTSSAKEYFYVSVEGEGSYLFTAKDLEKAKERADSAFWLYIALLDLYKVCQALPNQIN